MDHRKISRRDILKTSAAAFSFFFVPRHVLGGPKHQAPSDKLNVACIGVGGKGYSDTHGMASENIIALCDVDERSAARAFRDFPKAKRYKDYRKMFDELGDKIDAVTVSTPDHHHAPATMMALKLGKHVFCQKPLTHTIYEARAVAEEAKKQKVATIMGIQHHCSEYTRLVYEIINAGLIGDVTEIYLWTDRPIWPQGIGRPKDTPPVPKELAWDLWLGPAPERPYNPIYVPFRWRGWWDFGTGALGDMACHWLSPSFWALNLGYPTSIKADTTPVNNETYPKASTITYEFPAGKLPTGKPRPPVKLVWMDGKRVPPRPPELEKGRHMGSNGRLIIGTKGKIFNGRVIPEKRFQEMLKNHEIPKMVPRSPGIYREFIRACKGGEPTVADFEFSGKLTEVVLAGNLAIRAQQEIEWDGEAMHCKNLPEIDKYTRMKYRKGWTL